MMLCLVLDSLHPTEPEDTSVGDNGLKLRNMNCKYIHITVFNLIIAHAH